MRALIIRVTIFSVFLFSFPALGFCTTWHVDDDNTGGPWDGSQENPFQYIQDGIDAAVDGDTILVMPGLYVESINFGGKAITVKSSNGPDGTTIDGNHAGSVVKFVTGETADSVLDGFTVTKGAGSICPKNTFLLGGGIQCFDSMPKIINNIIFNNIVNANNACGGGIGCYYNSSPLIINNIIKENKAIGGQSSMWANYGGGISCENDSHPIITNNNIIKNHCKWYGGGISCRDGSSPMISNNTINNNDGLFYGGGISCLTHCSPTIVGNTIEENRTSTFGAGISCYYCCSPAIINNSIGRNQMNAGWGAGVFCTASSLPTITSNIIYENSGGLGGGIYCEANSAATITNNIICRNTVSGYGGGILCNGASPIITNNTLFGNSAFQKGGGVCCVSSFPTITNTIIWKNTAGPMGGSQIYVSSGNPTVTYCDVQGGWVGVGNIWVNPLFVDESIMDFHLRLGSPCVDRGNNHALSLPETDYEGDERVVDGNMDSYAVADMGADEILPEVAARFGNVNGSGNALSNVFHVNGSAGDNRRVYSISTGNRITMTMDAPPAGPNPSRFSLYAVGWEPGIADIALQPGGIGVSCIPMPLSNGSPVPPPYTLVNNIGYKNILGWPILPWIGPAPCTILNLPFGLPKGTYTFQGYLYDNGSAGPGVSVTNALVVKVQ